VIRERRLVAFARFPDVASADALVAFLATHDIDAHVEGADPLAIGLGGRVRVVLAEEDLRRASWVIENADFGNAQAPFLAGGDPGPSAGKDAIAQSGDEGVPRAAAAGWVPAVTLFLALALAARALLCSPA
jgi:hypothetical protein